MPVAFVGSYVLILQLFVLNSGVALSAGSCFVHGAGLVLKCRMHDGGLCLLRAPLKL